MPVADDIKVFQVFRKKIAVGYQPSAVRKSVPMHIRHLLLKAESRRLMAALVSLCLCVLPCPSSIAQESPNNEAKVLELPTFSVLQKTESFELKADTQEFTVKYPPILPNSERITKSDGKSTRTRWSIIRSISIWEKSP